MKKAFFIAIVLVLLLVINNLIRSIFDVWNKQDLLTQAQNELTKEQQKNQKLKAELSYVETQKFIEEEVRDKLFLVKPGEESVLIPNKAIDGQSGKKEVQKQIPNWQQWLQLFL